VLLALAGNVYTANADDDGGLGDPDRRDRLIPLVQADDALQPMQKELALEALGLVGRKNLNIDGKWFTYDCSGTVMAAMYLSGLNVLNPFKNADGTGVERLWQMGREANVLYDLPLPQVGDLIFWDNTWDADHNKKWDDQLTHVGLVVWVWPDGTVEYVHEDYARGITIARMNLFVPATQWAVADNGTRVELNSPLRMRSQEYLNPGVTLSSQLFRGFGRLWELPTQRLSTLR